MSEEIKCKWLIKSFGENHWVCAGLLKATDKEKCKNCKERLVDTNE